MSHFSRELLAYGNPSYMEGGREGIKYAFTVTILSAGAKVLTKGRVAHVTAWRRDGTVL